jgi:MOSC domain-containing protein YiiM
MTGRIVQISISPGGVPKTAIPEAEVTPLGLVGDGHRHPQIHGGVDKAVCLWSQDVIEQLRQEGHNLAPGYAGENVTIAGLDWVSMIPGTRLQLGDTVQLEIASYTTPVGPTCAGLPISATAASTKTPPWVESGLCAGAATGDDSRGDTVAMVAP